MRIRKASLVLIMLILASMLCFASESTKTFFVNLHEEKNSIYPIDSKLGQVVSCDSSPIHKFLCEALKAPFDYDWTENYVDSSSKALVSSLFSSTLSDLLPSEDFLLSKAKLNSDSSYSVSVRFIKSNKVLCFVIKDLKIIAISK